MINNNENKLENRVYDFFEFINACDGNGEIDELWKWIFKNLLTKQREIIKEIIIKKNMK